MVEPSLDEDDEDEKEEVLPTMMLFRVVVG